MSKRRAITLKQLQAEAFYKIPKFLWADEFKGLSNDAKVLYALLRDRCDLSKKNDWVDDYGRVFLIYTREEMGGMLEASKTKTLKSVKELLKHKLIFEKRNGLNKPNWIYINDVYIENTRTYDSDTSRDMDLKHQEDFKIVPSETEFNDTDNKETETLYALSSAAPCDYLNTYLKAYNHYLGKNHPWVRIDGIDRIEDFLSEVESEIELLDFERIVNGYFEDLPQNNNGNILAFIKAWPRVSDMYY